MGWPMKLTATAAGTLLAALLAGCGGITGTSVWVTPRSYEFQDCKQLVNLAQMFRNRTKELEQLMAKAASSPGGQVIGTLAYRTEYQQALGQEKEATAMAAEKRCLDEGSGLSAQSVF